MTYDATLTDYGVTELTTGNIRIGPAAFSSPDYLKATVIHEYGHSVLDRVFSGGKWAWSSPESAWNYRDGIIGYKQEIIQSGKMHIGRKVLSATAIAPGRTWFYGSTTLSGVLPLNPVWYAKGVVKNKWFHLLPRRF
jgi:hypothetical protein